MKIGIDSRFASGDRRGIGNYTLNLIQNLAGIDSENQYVLYIDRDDDEGVLPKRANFKTKRISPSNYLLWEQIALPLQARRDSLDILHCTGNTAPIFIDQRMRLISTIHDVMYLKDHHELVESASLYQRAGRFYRRTVVPRTIDQLSMAITVSEFSKNDISKHIHRFKNGFIRVTHEAAGIEFYHSDRCEALEKIQDKFNFAGDYILALGALDPRKNTELVIQKFIELKNECHFNEKLLIVGVPNWRQTDFYKIVQRSDRSKDIMFLDFVSGKDLTLLYSAATVFLYPSLYEGFGIPPLEAMACGVPVITSNTTSIPEVVGNAALLIDPVNGEEFKSALMRLLTDGTFRDVLRERGFKQARKFSWRKMALETLEVYKEVYGSGEG
jgi:glycosyltransferase involved in cell wall biosynthesis